MKNGIEYLLELNKRHSLLFDTMQAKRAQYRAKHKTEIAFIKCMDGRIHGAVMTRTPLGIIQPWRNLGGKFDLGWFGFAQSIREAYEYAIHHGNDLLVVITYHFARGDTHRGCRGFNYDVEQAREFTRNLKDQFDRVFRMQGLYAVQVGIETDYESFVLHGESGEMVDTTDLVGASGKEVKAVLGKFYPDMSYKVRRDLQRLVRGNISHTAEVRASNRLIVDAEHREWILGVGRGFDWLHEINKSLIVGPYDPNLDGAIRTAAMLIKGNIDEKRIKAEENGVVLLSSAPYLKGSGPERLLAEEKARFLNRFSLDIIRSDIPELIPHLQELIVTVDLDTRKIDVLS